MIIYHTCILSIIFQEFTKAKISFESKLQKNEAHILHPIHIFVIFMGMTHIKHKGFLC
jgi:hypothetical protein